MLKPKIKLIKNIANRLTSLLKVTILWGLILLYILFIFVYVMIYFLMILFLKEQVLLCGEIFMSIKQLNIVELFKKSCNSQEFFYLAIYKIHSISGEASSFLISMVSLSVSIPAIIYTLYYLNDRRIVNSIQQLHFEIAIHRESMASIKIIKDELIRNNENSKCSCKSFILNIIIRILIYNENNINIKISRKLNLIKKFKTGVNQKSPPFTLN